jgi:quercetin dioxygenase-like cupin family protein
MTNTVFAKGVQYSLKQSVEYAEGAVVSKIVTRNQAGNVTLFAFDSNQNLSEHAAPYDALVQVIEGEAIIRINKIDHLVSEGEIIIMPADIPHAVDAKTRFKMLLTMLKAKE